MDDTHDSAPSFNLLLVDDDLDVLGANARFLRLNDISVVLASSADVALERLQSDDIDAVITDLYMPDGDGFEFASKARALKPLVPIVFFSGYATVGDVVSAMRLGAVDFLEKPVEPELMLARVVSLRDRYEGIVLSPALAVDPADGQVPFKERVLAYEKLLIEQSLNQHDGKVLKVMEQLQINRRTLNDKMKRLGVHRTTFD